MSAPPLPLERTTGAVVEVDYDHHMIHRGQAFTAFYQQTTPTNIGEQTAIAFNTPTAAEARIHMLVDAWANDDSTFAIRESTNATLDQETNLAVRNRDRSSAATSLLSTIETVPVVGSVSRFDVAEGAAAALAAAGGLTLHTEILAVAAGAPFGSILNAQYRGQREWILLPSVEYIIILTNRTINDTIHRLSLNWYEMAASDNYHVQG